MFLRRRPAGRSEIFRACSSLYAQILYFYLDLLLINCICGEVLGDRCATHSWHHHRRPPACAAVTASTVIGIDVGGSRKGFHAVALSAGDYAGQLATTEVQELAHWCRVEVGAQLIAIDAPCRWSADGRARPCERELNAAGIRCSPPCRRRAICPMLRPALKPFPTPSPGSCAAVGPAPPTSAASAPSCCGRAASTRRHSPASI